MPVAGCGHVFVANITDVHSIWGGEETFNGVVCFISNPRGLQNALPYERDWPFLTPSLYSLELILSTFYLLFMFHTSLRNPTGLYENRSGLLVTTFPMECCFSYYGLLTFGYFASGQSETGVTHRTQYVPMHMAKCME